VATCFSGIESSESWLIDSGCTNHMTHDTLQGSIQRTKELKHIESSNWKWRVYT
jgi:hypothetical protein